MPTIQELAKTGADSFEDGQRDPPSTPTRFRRFAHDVEWNPIPEWATDLSRAAHDDGKMWPDDHRHIMIEAALDRIAETDPDDDLGDGDMAHEFADGAVSVYYHDRTAWLASHTMREGYCDDARTEGLVAEDADITDRIAAGWYAEALEVFNQVLEFLTDRASNDDDQEVAA
jgi:hypothetical protein